jgi:hypothetical protein
MYEDKGKEECIMREERVKRGKKKGKGENGDALTERPLAAELLKGSEAVCA